jgi:iron complex outermembrane recepter protein
MTFKQRFIISWMLMSLMTLSSAIAQHTITGSVYDRDSNQPIAGAHILVPNTTQGAVTAFDGSFSFTAEHPVDKLEVSFLGYTTKVVEYDEEMIIFLSPSYSLMNQLIVSANRYQQERKDAPIAIGRVNAAELNDTKPNNIDQVLNRVSGVHMVDLGNEQHFMSIRQPITTKGLFLYLEDGVPIRTTGLFNHNALIEINLAAVSNIEVIKGPASSIYGQEAIGGAVNFITQTPSPVQEASVSVQLNDIGYKKAEFTYSNTLDNLGLFFSGNYSKSDDTRMEYNEYDKKSLFGRVDYRLGEYTKLKTSFNYIDYFNHSRGSLDSLNFYQKEYSSNHRFTYRDISSVRVKSELSHFWNLNSQSSLTALFRDNSIKQNPTYRVRDEYRPWTGTGDPNLAHGEENDSSFKSYVIIAQHQEEVSWLNSSIINGLSIDYSPSSYDADYIRITKSDEGIYEDFARTDSVLTQYSVDALNYAAYTQVSLNPVQNLRLVGGIRYDHFVYDYSNQLPPTAFSGAPDSKDRYTALSPKLGFTYSISGSSGIYANFSQGFVPPQVSELYRGVSTPTLEPATFNNYELGSWLELFDNKLFLDATIYRLRGKNEIITVRLDDGTRENRNAGETEHTGLEMGVNFHPISSLQLRLSGSRASHKFIDFEEDGNDYSGNKMPGAPNTIINSEIVLKPPYLNGLRVALETQYLSNYYMDSMNLKTYSGYQVYNIRGSYSWNRAEMWIHWFNVTDEYYATSARASQWGQSFSLGNPSHVTAGIKIHVFN